MNRKHFKVVGLGADAIRKFRIRNPNVTLDLKGADLRQADLKGADLSVSDLRGVNLLAADLSEANLSQTLLDGAKLASANFQEANLSGASLKYVQLHLTKLIQANMQKATLDGAILDDADLSEADLRGAKLYATDLRGSTLNTTNLKEAVLGRTVFDFCDLSKAIGLHEVNHAFPSTIGFETLQLSHGKIPKVFLRGCGLPDSYIDYIPSMLGALNPIDFFSCFISYSHKDESFANRIHNDLQAKGVRCWLDSHKIKFGDEIYDKVDQGIRIWDKVLLCASKHSLNSGWVEREVETAIEMELQHRKQTGQKVLKIIPIDLDGSLREWKGAHGAALRKRLMADFKDWDKDSEKYDAQFKKLIESLNAEPEEDLPEPKLFKAE